tara:strand:+ start:3901 stop:4086 length:186 start_codon:yes stop_codon:yes gene_type:complete
LSENLLIQTAARLGEVWGTDPIEILNCTEEDWALRMACAKVVADDREREKQERDAISKRRR